MGTPLFNLSIKGTDKKTGEPIKAKVGTLWLNEDGNANLSMVEETDMGLKYPEFSFIDAIEKGYGTAAGKKAGKYLNVYPTKQLKELLGLE